MCYAIEMIKQEAVDEAVEAEKKAAQAEKKDSILNAIKIFRNTNDTEANIEKNIISIFNISSEDAKEYMHMKGF